MKKRRGTTKRTSSKRATRKRLNQEELHERIQRKAYELFEKRGYIHGYDQDDWFEAERLVKQSKS